MQRKGKILPWVFSVAAVIGGFIVALTLFFPDTSQSAQSPETRQSSVSPRIAAWQERVAEEKAYAEKEARRVEAEKAADQLARQQARERLAARSVTPKIVAEDSRAKEFAKEAAKERALPKQRAKRVAAQRQQQQQFFEGGSALGYASAPSQAQFRTIYSAMREVRGGN